MIAPRYAEYAPREELRPYVHCLWTFSAQHDPAPQPIAPDGRCEFILHFGTSYEEVEGRRRVAQPPALFAGQLTRPLTLVGRDGACVLGVRFRPDGARAFLGHDVDIATDRRISFGDETKEMRRLLRSELPELPHRLDLIQDFVEARIARSRWSIDPIVRAMVQRLMSGDNESADAALSERQLQRRFKREVGLSPRLFSSILRFRRVFDAIEHPETLGWLEAALAAGYFDQPQMARDFRRFMGVTARMWATQRAGLATAMAVSETYKTRSRKQR